MNLFIKPAYAQLQPTKDIGGEFDLSYGDAAQLIKTLTPIMFSIITIMIAFYFIIGAIELITSQGDKAHIVSARAKIYHSIIGFILLIFVFLIMQYLPKALGLTGFTLF